MAPKQTTKGNVLSVVPAPSGQKRYISYDQETLDHWITDGELDQLSELRKDYVVELFWGFLGIALGSALPAILLLGKIGARNETMEISDIATICTFFVFLILTVVMGLFWFQRSKRATDLTNKIRNRPKAPIGGPNGPV